LIQVFDGPKHRLPQTVYRRGLPRARRTECHDGSVSVFCAAPRCVLNTVLAESLHRRVTSGRRRVPPRSGHSLGYARHRNWPHHLNPARRLQHRGLRCHRSYGRFDDQRVAFRPVRTVDRVETHPFVAHVDLQAISMVLQLMRLAWPGWGLLGDDWLACRFRKYAIPCRGPATQKHKGRPATGSKAAPPPYADHPYFGI
jgi:hypothetical protein